MINQPVLELKNITKIFPGVVANDDVSISINKGEIHALVGENGAGKSTLMKIAAGIYLMDQGSIIVDGKPRSFHSPQDAFAVGISAVHQEFMLVDSLTVLENIVLGFEPRDRLGFLKVKDAEQKIKQIIAKYKMSVPLTVTAGVLPVAVRQQVEILKALYKNSHILILDEPTAVLTPQEINDLFVALRSLNELGTTIIFVTHKLNEVLSIADRVTVMRKGKVQGTLPVSEVTEEELARMMVGRDVVFRINKVEKEIDRSFQVLQMNSINLKSPSGYQILTEVALNVCKGEILGVAGVAGNGQTELIEVITGLTKPDSGSIDILGENYAFISTKNFREKGSYVCQDRQRFGSSPHQSIWENVLIGLDGERNFSSPAGILKQKPIYEYTRNIVDRFDVRTPNIFTTAESLSGGNLQKLILGRELTKDPALLVAEDPTRGLDVGATEYIRGQILQFAQKGRGVILVSQDLNELLMLSDRLVIIFKGEIVGEVSGDEATPELIGLYMMGLKRSNSKEKVTNEKKMA